MQLENHRKQIFWQVFLPLIMVCLILTALSFFLFGEITSGEANYRIWSDISMVVLTMPLILIFFLIFLFVSLLVFLIPGFNKKLKSIFNKINPFAISITHWIQLVSNGITQPVIFIESLLHHPSSDKINQNQE